MCERWLRHDTVASRIFTMKPYSLSLVSWSLPGALHNRENTMPSSHPPTNRRLSRWMNRSAVMGVAPICKQSQTVSTSNNAWGSWQFEYNIQVNGVTGSFSQKDSPLVVTNLQQVWRIYLWVCYGQWPFQSPTLVQGSENGQPWPL